MAQAREVFQVAYYKPADGSVRIQGIGHGDAERVDVSYQDVLDGARPGEVPLAGIHNHLEGVGSMPGPEDFAGNDLLSRETQRDFGLPFQEYVFTVDNGRPVVSEFGRATPPPATSGPLSPTWPAAQGQILDNAQRIAAILQQPGLPALKKMQVLSTLESVYARAGAAFTGLEPGLRLAPTDHAALDRQLSTARTLLAPELRAAGAFPRRDVNAVDALRRRALDELGGLLRRPDFSPAAVLRQEGVSHLLGVGPSGSLVASAFAQRAQAEGWSGDLGYMIPLPAQREPGRGPGDFVLSGAADRFRPGDTVLVLDDVEITGRTRAAVERFWRERFPGVDLRFGTVLGRDHSREFVRSLGYEPPPVPLGAERDLVLARTGGDRP